MKLIFKICEKELKKRKLDFNSRRSLKLLPKRPANRMQLENSSDAFIRIYPLRATHLQKY